MADAIVISIFFICVAAVALGVLWLIERDNQRQHEADMHSREEED